MPIDDPEESAGDDVQPAPEAGESLQDILGRAVERAFDPNRVPAMSQQTSEGIRRALDIRTELVTDPAIASYLASRHNSHIRSAEIADHGYRLLKHEGDPNEHRDFFEALRADVKKHGIFVYPYSTELESGRILATYPDGSKQFVIVETFARIQDPDNAARKDVLSSCADAQFHVPYAHESAASVIEWPRQRRRKKTPAWRRDQIYDEDLVEEMKSMPHSVASLDDLASDRDIHKLRLAGTAMHRGIQHIVHELNPTRGAFPVRFLAAEIVSIQGFKMKNANAVVRLQNDLQVAPILNGRSVEVFDHFNSPDCESFQTAWIRRGSLVPVDHPEIESLIVDWHVKVARLKQSEA